MMWTYACGIGELGVYYYYYCYFDDNFSLSYGRLVWADNLIYVFIVYL